MASETVVMETEQPLEVLKDTALAVVRQNDLLTDHVNISGDEVTQSTAWMDPEQRDLVRWLYGWIKDNHWGWSEAEKQSLISRSTLYRIWKNSYVNPKTGERVDLTKLCAKITRLKTLADARAADTRLPFIETSVWKRISKVCSEALADQAIAMIYGESQIGKTACLKEVQRRNNHGQTIYVLMPASGGVQSMMAAIADACHISTRTCFEQLRKRVERYLDHTKLLIIDEVHECFVSYQKGSMAKCLSVLRQLQEVTGCGMVMCGTNVFRNELEHGEFSQSLKQLRKRGVWELQLEASPTDDDLMMIAQHYDLPSPTVEAQELIVTIAQTMGLGKYTKFLARAAKLARDRKEKFVWHHFSKVVGIAERLRKAPNQPSPRKN